jgi:hypothetical protein
VKIGDKVRCVRLIEIDEEDSPEFLIGQIGEIVGIAEETCSGLPMCPYDVEFDLGGLYYMEAEELEVI